MSTKCCAQLLVNVKILTIFCMVSSDWTTRGSSDLLQNWTHQFTRNMICFYPFDFIMQGKLIILRSRCFLHQNTSQRGMHSVVRLKKKRGGKAIIRTPKSATAQETTNVLVYVRKLHLLQTRKMTNPFTTIVRMQKNQPRTKSHVPIEFLFNGCPELLCFSCVGTILLFINDAFWKEAFYILAFYLFWKKRKLLGLFQS